MAGVFKTTKKLLNSSNETSTLDIKHKEMLNKFRIDYTGTKPELEREKADLLLRFKNDNLSIDEKIAICDALSILKLKLKNIKKAEKDYLLNNSQYIFEYFENKKNIAECKNKPTVLEHFFTSKEGGNNDEKKTKGIRPDVFF